MNNKLIGAFDVIVVNSVTMVQAMLAAMADVVAQSLLEKLHLPELAQRGNRS